RFVRWPGAEHRSPESRWRNRPSTRGDRAVITEVDSARSVCSLRGDFERRLDDLAGLCRLYEQAAAALGKPGIAEAAHAAVGALGYGVTPELVPGSGGARSQRLSLRLR